MTTQFKNPINQKNHKSWEGLHKAIGKEIKKLTATRDSYESITNWDKKIYSGQIIRVFTPALEAEYIDLDKKGRGSCLNHDLYGYDPAQGVAVIQARQYFKRAASHFGATHKTYFLVGLNEITGQFFRHPVGSHAIRAAIKNNPDPASVVKAAQRWMWEVTEKQLAASVRQGDILLVPEKEPKIAKAGGMSITVGGSHKILADEIRLNGKCYALNPRMIHTKNQHSPVELMGGWYSIRVGREADAWDFAARIGD